MPQDFSLAQAVQQDEERQRRRQQQTAGQNLFLARPVAPERAALAQQAAGVLGRAPIEVENDPTLQAEAQATRQMQTLSQHHRTIEWLENPENAAVAHDQVEPLTEIERTLRRPRLPAFLPDPEYDLAVARRLPGGAIEGIGRSIEGLNIAGVRALDRMGLGDSGIANYFRAEGRAGRRISLGGRNLGGTLTDEERQLYRERGARNLLAAPNVETGLMGDVSGGLGQVSGQVLIAAATGGYGTLPSMFGQGVSSMDDRVQASQQREGRTEYSAADDAALIAGGAVTVVTEKLGLDAILGRLPKPIRDRLNSKLADIMVAGLTEGTTEVAEGVGQNLLASSLLNEDVGALDGSIQSGSVGAAVGSIARALVMTAIPGRQHVNNQLRADAAATEAQRFDQVADMVAANPLLERAPERLREFLSGASDNQTVYVPAEAVATFFQSNPDLQEWIDEWDIRDQYEAALAGGSDIAFDVGTYLTKVAPTQAHQVWRQDLRHGLDAMSLKEAEAWSANAEQSLSESFDSAFTEAEAMGREGEPTAAVYQDLFGQMRAAGYTVDVAQKQATLATTFFARRAERSGGRFADAFAAYQDAGLSIRQEFPQSLRERMDRTDVLIEGLRQARKAPSQRRMFGRSLNEFVSQEGGILDTGGDLAAIGADQWHRGQRFRRKLVRQRTEADNSAYETDAVLTRAKEAGYLPEDATVNDLVEAIRSEIAGKPVYSRDFDTDPSMEENRQALDDLERVLADLGMDPATNTNAEIKAALDRFANAGPDPAPSTTEEAPKTLMQRARALADRITGRVPESVEPVVLYQSDKLPFFSALERAVETTNLTKAPAAQWKATLAKTPGVKKEEIEWSGLNDWLDLMEQSVPSRVERGLDKVIDAKGNIPRDEVLSFLRAGGVRVDEVVLGGSSEAAVADYAETLMAEDPDLGLRDAMAQARRDSEEEGGPAQYRQYKMTGADDSYRELLLTLPGIQGPSTHWDAANVVAHTRFTERLDEDGKRVLFLEEVQSDWHQKGRDEGYQQPLDPAAVTAAEQGLAAAEARRADVVARLEPLIVPVMERVIATGRGEITRLSNELDVALSDKSVNNAEIDRLNRILQQGEQFLATRIRTLSAITTGNVGAREVHVESAIRVLADTEEFRAGDNQRLISEWRSASLAETEARMALRSAQDPSGIADAPFRTSWSTLIMKRMIGYAVAHGYDKVSWINGDQQNGGQTGGDGSFFYERNLVNTTNDLVKKYGAKVERSTIRFGSIYDKLTPERRAAQQAEDAALLAELGADTSAPPTGNYGFDITPALADQVDLRGGFPLFQRTQTGPRGQIALGETGAVITLFKARDLSTFFHEFGHLTLELMIRDAADPNASEQVKADLRLALDHMNVRDPGDIGVDQHELWARSLEAYLLEGRSPSLELRTVFKAVKGWMLSIYRTVLNLNAPLSDEVRSVFDRLLASDEEIEAATVQLGIEAGFADAEQAGMTPQQFADYTRQVQRARSASEDDLMQRMMRTIRRERTAEWNAEADAIRPDVTDEIDQQPDIRAMNWLRGSKVAMSREIVVRMLGDEAGLALLPKSVPPIVGKNGVHPDSVAEVAGYKSGSDLLNGLMELEAERQALLAANDKRSVRAVRIEREITERLREQFGDPLTDGSIEAEAMAALHGDRQGEVLATELSVLARRVGQTPPPLAALRAWAAEQIGSRTVRDAKPGKYLRAERKAANAVQRALAAKDRGEAFRQKQAQTINHLLYSEARKAEEFADRAVRRLGKLDKSRSIRSMDQDYLEQIHALLEQYELRQASGAQINRRKALMEFVAEREALGEEVVVPPALITAAQKKNYAELTVDELRALDDTVRSLAHLGRLKQTLLDNRDRRDYEAVVDEFLGSTFDLKNRKGLEGRNRKPNKLRQFDAALWKIETLADWLDRDNVSGVMNRILIRPAVDAANREDQLHEGITRLIRNEYDAVPREQKKRWREKVTTPELIDQQTGEASVFDRSDLVAMALNTGNPSNFDKLTRGEEWSPDDVMTVLNRELSVEEWTMVQGIWDALETLWPDIAATERTLTGVEPERVVPMPIQTSAGELRGGYYPVVYDPARRANAAGWAALETADLFNGVIRGAATSKGHTKERTNYAGPVLLSVEGVLFGHLNKVIKRVAYAEYVSSARKFIIDDRVRKVITDKVGPEYYDQLMPWLQGQVTDRGGSNRDLVGLEAFVKKARLNFQMVAMGLRVTTFMAQFAGYAQSAALVGKGRLAASIVNYAMSIRMDRNSLSDFVFEKSPEMASRMQTRDRDIRDAMRELTGKTGVLSEIQRAAFVHIGIGDQMVSVPTWLAAYQEVLAKGGEEGDAIAAGDKAVRRSQGTGREYALAAVQRPNSEFMKLFTLFYSYFSVQYNRQRDMARYATTGDPAQAISMAWWVMIVAPVMGALLTGDWPDEDDGEGVAGWASWASRKMFFNLFSGVPGVRDFASYAERKVGGEYASYSPTPLSRVGDSVETLSKDATDLATGEDVSDRWLKHAIETPGYFIGLPTGQVGNTAQYVLDVFDGSQQPENVGEFLYGLAKGPQESQE